jgi:hypothetical protein
MRQRGTSRTSIAAVRATATASGGSPLATFALRPAEVPEPARRAWLPTREEQVRSGINI